MIEVAVGQDDRRGRCVTADEVPGRAADRLFVTAESCVDQEPRSAIPHDEYVHHHRAVEKNVVGHLLRIHVLPPDSSKRCKRHTLAMQPDQLAS